VKVRTAANDFLISFVGDDLTPELRRLWRLRVVVLRGRHRRAPL